MATRRTSQLPGIAKTTRIIDTINQLWYTVATMRINIRKAREKFSEIINTVAIKGERVILLSNKKAKAAIVSLKDLEMLEMPTMKRARRLAQIERIRKIREAIHQKGIESHSTMTLQRIREDRTEELSGRN